MLFGRRKRQVKRILIVEDEPLVAFDNETMVAGAGYTVVATVDKVSDALAVLERELTPADGEAAAEAKGVDLILTDITLAGDRTGYDLAREAKRRNIPVLFVTASPPENADDLALGYLLKPYQERTLRAALKMADRRIAGERVKAIDGLVFFPVPAPA